MTEDQTQLKDRLDRMAEREDFEFTLERGQGETYSDGKPTLYALGTYEDGVLAGQQKRCFVESWDSFDDAKTDLVAIGWWKSVSVLGGTTHVSVDRMVAHLPDEDCGA